MESLVAGQELLQNLLISVTTAVASRSLPHRELHTRVEELDCGLKAFEARLFRDEHNVQDSGVSPITLSARRQFVENSKLELDRLRDRLMEATPAVSTSHQMIERSAHPTSSSSSSSSSTARQEDPHSSQPSTLRRGEQIPNASRTAQPTRFFVSPPQLPGDTATTSFLGAQRDQQQLLLSHQDRALDELAIAAERLSQTASVINVELQDQQRMLDHLDEDIDRETEHMNAVMRRMAKVFQTSSRRQLCLILWLTVVFLVLLFLVLV